MHKSRLCALVLDTDTADLDGAARFWAAALGREVRPINADHPTFRSLGRHPNDPIVLVQQVTHAPRVHLDIETDDLDAEVARLERLGAKRVAFVKEWWVMEAPSGHRFCVVKPLRGELDEKGNQWP